MIQYFDYHTLFITYFQVNNRQFKIYHFLVLIFYHEIRQKMGLKSANILEGSVYERPHVIHCQCHLRDLIIHQIPKIAINTCSDIHS